MPHICTRCHNTYQSAKEFEHGCPHCGCMKFLFKRDPLPSSIPEPVDHSESEQKPGPVPDQRTEKNRKDGIDPASPETIRIIEPGMYDLNLLKLAESDDRVIRTTEDESFRLDLLSMGMKKKKK